MLFTLEMLRAKKGDALLLHVGEGDDRRLVVIDGGPSGVYRQSLKPRLDALRKARAPEGQLVIDLLMISHIDDDHIKGILDLTNKLIEQVEDQEPRPYKIVHLWHNGFDDVVGNKSEELRRLSVAEVGEDGLASASLEGVVPGGAMSTDGALVLASVNQGRALRDNAKRLGLQINAPAGGRVLAADGAKSRVEAPAGIEGLELLILGPSRKRVEELADDWEKKLPKLLEKERAQSQAAAYLDRSVYNLASLVVLARVEDKSILLTGDGRGDDVLEGARAAGLLAGGPLHLDLLKLPHHGSSRNVELDFFQHFTADGYVVSGDGAHGNPDVETLEMLFESRRGDPRSFTLYLTYQPEDYRAYHGKDYPVAELRALFERERQAGAVFEIVTPEENAVSFPIDLLDPYDGR